MLQLPAEEGQVKEIAAVLDLSPKTVEFHKYRIMDLLGVRTVADLIRYAIKRGIGISHGLPRSISEIST